MLTRIHREKNLQADALANLGSALETKNQMCIPLLVVQWPTTKEEIVPKGISIIERETIWMTPNIKYQESDTLPNDCNKSRRVKKKAARYCLSRGRLFRRSFFQLLSAMYPAEAE